MATAVSNATISASFADNIIESITPEDFQNAFESLKYANYLDYPQIIDAATGSLGGGGGVSASYVNSQILTTSIALNNTDRTNSASLNNSLIVGLNTWAARTASQNVDMDGNNIASAVEIQFQSLTDGLGQNVITRDRLAIDEDGIAIINWSKYQASAGGILTFNRENETATLGMSLTLTDAPLYCNTLNTQISNQWIANIGQTNKASLKADNLSTNRTIQLPDIAGNLASESYVDTTSIALNNTISTTSIAINNRLTPVLSTSTIIASTITTANLRATATIIGGTITANNIRATAVNPRSTTTATTSLVGVELINYDQYLITALANTVTINPAISSYAGHKILIGVKDNGTPRSVVFQSPSVRAFGGRTLTQTTTSSKYSYFGVIYNNSAWDLIASTTEN